MRLGCSSREDAGILQTAQHHDHHEVARVEAALEPIGVAECLARELRRAQRPSRKSC
jgi:hypothetical protein